MNQLQPPPQIEVAIAIIFDTAISPPPLLICQRKPDAVLANLWEFPGGKCFPGESPGECAMRETREETNLDIEILRALPVIEHAYAHAYVRMHPFVCRVRGGGAGALKPLEVAAARWIAPRALAEFQFPPANAALLREIAKLHGEWITPDHP